MKVPHCVIASSLAILFVLATPESRADSPESRSRRSTIVYITRHGEDVPELVGADPSFSVSFNHCLPDGSCCEEVLNPLGRQRVAALADWFYDKGITRTLTHVIASHKIRTRQTVAKIAQLAGLGGDLDGDGILDGSDVDQAPGDGVINVPSTPLECDPGFTSSSSALKPQSDFLKSLPIGSRAVLCSHSPVIYPLMQDLGIDVSDPVKFPKDARGRVVGFNNLWVIELKPVTIAGATTYQGRLLSHLVLDIEVGVSLIERNHRDDTHHSAKEEE